MKRGSSDSRIGNQRETVALVGNYVPRQCGIATFTTDLRHALADLSTDREVWAVAMNDRPGGYAYPPPVRFEVNQNQFPEYPLAANFLNMNRVDLVCLQHEFGIYGGDDGAHVLSLLRDLRMPLVTTLHTVLSAPTPGQRSVMEELVRLSDRLVVMSNLAVDILTSTYAVDSERVRFIPHGIPDVQFIDPNYYKDQFGVEGRKVILTFGLIGPGKGLEHVIDALPRIAEQFPEIVYLIVGATHPNVKRESGESYRISLQHRARQLGVQDNVMFHNRFVSLDKLCEFLICADLYITPYLSRDQITSGTLAYAMGAGKAVISTPYLYAEEMLADGRGRLVPFADPDAIAGQVLDLFDHPNELNAIRKRVYKYTRNMVWKQVAQSYVEMFADLQHDRTRDKHTAYPARTTTGLSIDLPAINLDHLKRLTDDTGILHHARFMIPSRIHGYSTDDNARALITVMSATEVSTERNLLDDLANRYLGFLDFAFDTGTRRFRNFLSYARRWSSAKIDEDCTGRSLWSLGVTVALSRKESQSAMAMDMFERALPACDELQSPRAIALALLGCIAYGSRFKGDRDNQRTADMLAARLLDMYRKNATETWPWIEDKVTHNNGRIPQAMIAAGRVYKSDDLVTCGTQSLEWLLAIQDDPAGHFVPIGNNGWYPKGGRKARYDQQPIEACAMIDACAEAYATTREQRWADALICCFDWFLGRNDLQMPVYDFTTGGCRDGLASKGVNQNQGAESTLSWLMSLISLYRSRAKWGTVPGKPRRSPRAKSD
jgi:glycosyltransferase involved in cell wall biosynthesis